MCAQSCCRLDSHFHTHISLSRGRPPPGGTAQQVRPGLVMLSPASARLGMLLRQLSWTSWRHLLCPDSSIRLMPTTSHGEEHRQVG